MAANELPSGWCASTYGDVMVEVEERAGERAELPVLSLTKAHGPMLASERFSKALHSRDLSRYRIARRGQIVADPMLLWDGAIGVQRAVDAGLVSPDYRVYEPGEKVNPAFLSSVLRSPLIVPYYQGGARGTNVRRNRIARSDFLRIPLSLPPIAEQRKIAAILSAANDAIKATQAVIDQLQVVKKAMMAELLTRGLPERHTRFKQTDIGIIPESWITSPLSAVLEGIDAGWSPKCDSQPAEPNEWGVLKVSAASWGEFRGGENKRLPLGLEPRPDIEVKPGDVIISRANTPDLVGRSVFVRTTRTRLLLSDKLLRLRPHRHLMEPAYLDCVLGSSASRVQIEDGASGSSRSMKNISQESLRTIMVPVPPLDEQRSIASGISGISIWAQEEARVHASLQDVKAALMSVLLTGEVRVTPDEDAT